MTRSLVMNSTSSSSCCCATWTSWPAAGCSALARAHAAIGSPPLSREATRRNSSCVAWSSRIAMSSRRSAPTVRPSSNRSLCSKSSRPSRNDPFAARCDLPLEVFDVAAERRRRLGRHVGEIAEDVQVVERAERARQILVDEPQRAAQALESDLDEDARRVLDVVLGRLHESRHLAQLGHDAPGALGERGVAEERLAGEARRQHVGVVLRDCAPRCGRSRSRRAGRGCWPRARDARAARSRSGARDRWRPGAGRTRQGPGRAHRSPAG